MNTLITFKSFNDKTIANEIAELLIDKGIECNVEDNSHYHNQTLAGATFENLINLKISPENFNTAREVLHNYYKDAVESTQSNYYLFEFTNEELLEIISKPDEWGEFDYLMSQKILNERGIEISEAVLDSMFKERSKEISQKEGINKAIIIEGYLYAFLGGIGAIIWGYSLVNSKKTLLNGEQTYTYGAAERKHGQRIFSLGCISLIIWVIIILISMFYKDKLINI